jgi:hypothetical protein
MKNYLHLAKKIQEDLEENPLDILEEQNLKEIFSPILRLNHTILKINATIAYIILAYSNGSPWLDLNKDRLQNKIRILEGMGIEIDEYFQSVIDCENNIVNSVVGEYLQEQASWEFQQAAMYLDSYQKLVKLSNEKVQTGFTTEELNKDGNIVKLTTEYSADQITKAHNERAKLLTVAHENRVKADELIAKLKGEYVQLHHAVQQDFGFDMLDGKKNLDPASWRHFIKYDYMPRKKPA